MQMGLVVVAAVRRDLGCAFTRDQTVHGMVEADQLRGTFRWNADVRVKPGPQTLAAPSEFGRQVIDPDEAPADDDPVPGPVHRRVHRRRRLKSAGEERVRKREAVLPRGDFAQLLANP